MIPGSRRSSGEVNDKENPMDREAWQATVHGVTKSRTHLSNKHTHNEATEIKNRPMDIGGGKEGEDEIYRDSNMETYSSMCKTDSQWEFAT